MFSPPVGQMRIDGEVFSPERDIVNAVPVILHQNALRVAQFGWPNRDFQKLAEEAGVAVAELAKALPAMTKFVEMASHHSREADSYEAVFRGCGLMEMHPLARMAVLAHAGASVLQVYHHYCRLANRAGYIPRGFDIAVESAEKAQWAAEAELPSKRAKRVDELDEAIDRNGNEIGG